MNILIADSGSTKTDWVLVTDKGEVRAREKSEGINPVHQQEETIAGILSQLPETLARPDRVCFYGSGLRPEYRNMMRQQLAAGLDADPDSVEAEGDLLGAARALCCREEGIACILGTGANSCVYDGSSIVANTPPMGYVLGDEGSGAVIGRNLLNGLYKGALPEELRKLFEDTYGMTLAEVIGRVYRKPLANRWLASLSPFISQHKGEYPELGELVVRSFADFLRNNIRPYRRNELPLSATGSIAHYYHDELARACADEGLLLKQTCASPMEGLIRYHTL